MKVLGTITPEFNEDGMTVNNGQYVGGKIIAFTTREAALLSAIQQASAGQGWHWDNIEDYRTPEDVEMSDIFRCIYNWVIARFRINDMQKLVDDLKGQLEKIEVEPEE